MWTGWYKIDNWWEKTYLNLRYKFVKWLCSLGHMQGNIIVVRDLYDGCVNESETCLYANFTLLEDAILHEHNLNYAYTNGPVKLEYNFIMPCGEEYEDQQVAYYTKYAADLNKLVELYKWWLDYKIRSQKILDKLDACYTNSENWYKELFVLEDEATSKLVELVALRDYLYI